VQFIAHLGINHEAKYVLNTVECKDSAIGTFPQAFIVGTATFDGCPELVDELGVSDSNLQVRTLLVALKAIEVLP